MSALFSYLLVIAAGMAVAFQQVLNANLRVGLASPWWAGTTNYLIGGVAMLGRWRSWRLGRGQALKPSLIRIGSHGPAGCSAPPSLQPAYSWFPASAPRPRLS